MDILDPLRQAPGAELHRLCLPKNDSAALIHFEPAPRPRAKREEFFFGDTVRFIDKHLSKRVGIIVRLNSRPASIAVTNFEGHWRV